MKTAGGQAKHHIASCHLAAIEDLGSLNHAHGKAGQVVFAIGVHAGHLGCFTTNQGAARGLTALGNAAHHGGGRVECKSATGEIIQKEEWLRPLNENVVHTHGHEVDAHGVVPVQGEGQLELGAHAIGAGHQHGLHQPFGQAAQGAEATNAREHLWPHGALGQRLDAVDESVAGIDVHASVAVGQAG